MQAHRKGHGALWGMRIDIALQLFIYLKVLGLSQTSPLIYQKALLSEELISIFETAKADPAAIAQDKLRELYEAKLSGDAAKITALEEKYQKRKKVSEDDLCPVWYV